MEIMRRCPGLSTQCGNGSATASVEEISEAGAELIDFTDDEVDRLADVAEFMKIGVHRQIIGQLDVDQIG